MKAKPIERATKALESTNKEFFIAQRNPENWRGFEVRYKADRDTLKALFCVIVDIILTNAKKQGRDETEVHDELTRNLKKMFRLVSSRLEGEGMDE